MSGTQAAVAPRPDDEEPQTPQTEEELTQRDHHTHRQDDEQEQEQEEDAHDAADEEEDAVTGTEANTGVNTARSAFTDAQSEAPSEAPTDADADADEVASELPSEPQTDRSYMHTARSEAQIEPSEHGDGGHTERSEAPLTERSEAPTERSERDDESKQPVDHFAHAIAAGVSTGMQADDAGGEQEDDEEGGEEAETQNAGGQTGDDGQAGVGGDQSLPVEVTILPDGFKHIELFRGDESIAHVKAILGERFKLDPRDMRLALGDLALEDDRALIEYREFDLQRLRNRSVPEEDLRAQPLRFDLTLDSADDAAESESAGPPPEPYKMPDIIKVVINREEIELEAEEDEEKESSGFGGGDPRTDRTPEQVVYVQVLRDNLHHPKPFLGGFRHKYYGTVYHHASSQTARKKKKQETVKFHRETQTIQIVSRSQQTNREAGTQMERRDLLQDHSNDTVIMSRPYFTADELEALRDEKAREVQCFLRQCFAWRRVRRLRESKAEQLEADVRARAAKAKQEAEDHARQIQRRMHPRTKEDFAVLFAELESWRLHETQRIKSSGLASEEVSSALQELLNKEVKLLQTIDRLKITAASENKWSRTRTALEKMASPKEWSSSEGDLIEVETPFTTRAKELVDLYNGLCLRNLSRAQRVDVLLHIKYTVKEFDCELSREIVELIKREEDLLRRQRSEASLEGCRKRIQNLFLQFVNTPLFNPEAGNFQRVAPDGGVAQPPPALSSSLAKPAMLTKTNTITVAANVAGRIFADRAAAKAK